MTAPLMPPPLDHVGQRRFAFYPAIVNAEPNEWLLRSASWSEVQIVNARTGQEIWIPRQYFGTISEVDDPILIVGLIKELEFRAGTVWPVVKRVIEMPRAVNQTVSRGLAPREQPAQPAPVIGIKLENGTESRIWKLMGVAAVGTVVVSFLAISLFRGGALAPHVSYSVVPQNNLGLTTEDDYDAVVRHLGPPARDEWQSDQGALQFRSLWYPKEQVSVILMGQDRKRARYVGTMNTEWQVVHSVKLGRNADSRSLLQNLPKF